MQGSLQDSFAGCLLGLALGDSLGEALEGHSGTDLLQAYLEDRYNTSRLTPGKWTDDTALAVATAQSIAERGCVDGPDLAARYLAWFQAGGRGIGRSTREAMQRLLDDVAWDLAGDEGEGAAGNGVAMRIAPVGLLHARNLDGLGENVRTCGVITHRNEEALVGGEAVAYAVARATCGDFDAEMLGIELLGRMPPSRCRDSIEHAMELWQTASDPVDALEQLGCGGSAFETVATSLYCIWHSGEDFERAICLSVLAGGDADTRGAICGAILGARVGVGGLPPRWLTQLPAADTIVQLAGDLLKRVLNI